MTTEGQGGRRDAALQAFDEAHGSAAYLADNLAAVTIERDEFAAEVEQLQAELDRYRRCPGCATSNEVARGVGGDRPCS